MDETVTALAGEGGKRLAAARLPTPLGEMLAVFGRSGLCMLAFDGEKHFAAEVRALCRHYAADGLYWCEDDERVTVLREELAAYFSGSLKTFATALEPVGTPFQLAVWRELQNIAYGETCSYAQQAARLGRSDAVRAVAAANGRNKISIIVPCHRVIGSNGRLTGYAGGLWRKQALLDGERGVKRSGWFQAA